MRALFVLRVLAASILVFGVSTLAETVEVLGRELHLQAPPGYCSLNEVDWGPSFMRKHAETYVKQGVLLQIAVLCSEVGGGPAVQWTRWIVVIAPPRKNGQMALETRTRQEVLDTLGSEVIDLARINRLLASGSDTERSARIESVMYAGSDEWGGYWVTRGERPIQNGEKRSTYGVMAGTVVNEVALGIQVQQYEGSIVEPLEAARAYVRSLFP